MHKLQTVVAPDVFSPRAVYDGKALLYAPRVLPLPASGSSTVCPYTYTIYRLPPLSTNIPQFYVSLTPQAPVVGARGTVEVRVVQTLRKKIEPES